jgi:outer membrane protein TolC
MNFLYEKCNKNGMYKKWFTLIILLTSLVSARAQEYKIGVVTDFVQSAELDSIIQTIVNQFDQTLGSGKEVILLKENVSYQNLTLKETAKNYGIIAAKTNLVVLIGGNSIKAVSKQKSFPKPTLGIGVLDPLIQEIPYVNGKSGISNFTYICAVNRLETDLSTFKKIVPFKHLTFMVNPGTTISLNENKTNTGLSSLEEKLGIKIDILEMGKDVEVLMNGIKTETDAVYISDLGIMSNAEIRHLSNRLVERKLPSFSGNTRDVYQGIMACQADENSFDVLLRKLGVMVDDAFTGKPLENMDVTINYAESLSINERTLAALNINLPFELLFTSKSVKESGGLPTYSFENIIEIAFKNNLKIAISNQEIELAIQHVKTAKSAVLPNLDLFMSGRQINVESANAMADQPQSLVSGKLQLDQVIYSQKAIAGIKIAKYYEKAREFLTEAEIQEVILSTFDDYLNVLSAKSVLAIEKENLENLEINLNIAKLQVNTGALGRAELYRWESELAKAKQNVVLASTNLSEYKIILNNRLAYVLEKEYDIKDITINDEIYKKFRAGTLSKLINNVHDIQVVTDFLVKESQESNPNKKYILEQMNAYERQQIQNKRLFYLPDISFQAQTNQTLVRGGIGSAPINGIEFNNNTWSLGVGLKYPVFAQSLRKTELKTSTIKLDQLNNSMAQLDNDLELAVRSSMLKSIAASTNIDFSRIASENADNNFKLMQVRYKGGDVDITQLIDAQRASMQSKLGYAVSVFDYIRSQLNIEFAVGFFSILAPENKIEEFRNRFIQYSNSLTNEK